LLKEKNNEYDGYDVLVQSYTLFITVSGGLNLGHVGIMRVETNESILCLSVRLSVHRPFRTEQRKRCGPEQFRNSRPFAGIVTHIFWPMTSTLLRKIEAKGPK
jgi:hypothetical protein